MSSQDKRSRRFVPTKWAQRLVPLALVLLLLALLATILLIVLSVLGLVPA